MPTANELLNKLPDNEKAKIANTLLDDVRKRFGSNRLGLVASDTPANLAVDFWRVSSTDQRDGYSLEAQESKAVEYKKAAGLKSVKSWAVSESASKEFDRRKFFEMISFVMENGIKNVVFDRIDRACRGLRAAVLIEDLIEAGVRFHFVRDNLVVDKHSSPSEKLRFYLGVVLAKWYIDNLKTEVKKGMNTRQAEGYFNSKAPVGYVNVRPKFGKANLEIHAGVGEFIAECFELYKTGNYSRKDLEKIGLERGIRWQDKRRVCDENGNSRIVAVEKHVTHKMLEYVLVNPAYCQCRRVNGKVVRVENAKWPALISYETFMACQKIKGIRAAQKQLNTAVNIPKPLMQLMRCRECGHVVTGEIKRKASGKTYVYYHCANPRCSQRRINTEQKALLSQFAVAFEPFARFTPKATAAFVSTIRKRAKDISLYSVREVNELKEKQAQLNQRLQEVEDLQQRGVLSATELNSLEEANKQEVDAAEVEIGMHLKADLRTMEVGLNIIELLRKSSEVMCLEGFELKKAQLLKSMLSNPTLKDGTVEFDYRKPFDDLLNLTGGRNWSG